MIIYKLFCLYDYISFLFFVESIIDPFFFLVYFPLCLSFLTQLKTLELSQQKSKPWRNIMAVFSYGPFLGTNQLLLQWSWLSSECVQNIIWANISITSSSKKMLLCLSQWVFCFLYHMTSYFLWLIPFISFLKS